MHKTWIGVAALVACALAALGAQSRTTLDMYLIDVEGGNATLFVAPGGETMLIDTGNGGAAATRDADRIAAAAKDAGITRIDHLITTHYHGDHFGAMAEVAARLPVRSSSTTGRTCSRRRRSTRSSRRPIPRCTGKTHTVVKPGDALAVSGLDVRIVAAGGTRPDAPLPGAGAANPYCAAHKPQDPDPGENAQSVGTHVTFGRFRLVHLGDLTWNKEFDLMCPANRLGTVDVFVVSHHGQPISNSEVLVHALRPRVALLNNGTRKGGQPPAMRVLFSSPGLGGPVAAALLAAERSGVHGAGDVHRERDRRAAVRDAHRARGVHTARAGHTGAARAQRCGILAEAVRAPRRIVRGHQRAERVQEDLRGTLTRAAPLGPGQGPRAKGLRDLDAVLVVVVAVRRVPDAYGGG